MKDGDINCVAHRVIEHFESAVRGNGLTAFRRQKIEEWAKNVYEPGASINNVSELEKIIKRSIAIKDICKLDVFNSGTFQSRRLQNIELIMQNGHAWNKNLEFPKNRKIHFYEGDVWQTILKTNKEEPKSVCVLGGGDEKNLSPNLIQQFILADGSVYRTKQIHDDILTESQKQLAEDEAKALAECVLSKVSAVFKIAKEKNDWHPTPKIVLGDIQKARVEFGHGGLWCHPDGYMVDDVVSLDMSACYPASFWGVGDCAPYFKRYGHPSHRLVRVAVNGNLPDKPLTGFAEINSWEFSKDVHPVIPAWFGRHFCKPAEDENVKNDRGWVPIHLLRFMLDTGVLTQLTVSEAIVSLSKQTQVWLPDDKEMSRIIIGKLTQGGSNDCKQMTRRWVQNKAEVDFLARDLRETNSLVGYDRVPFILDVTNFEKADEIQNDANGHVVTYYEGYQLQYTHLRASMLGYASINIISMLQRFQPVDVRRVATDSLFISPALITNLEDVPTFTQFSENAQWGQWRVKDEKLLAPTDTAPYLPKPEY